MPQVAPAAAARAVRSAMTAMIVSVACLAASTGLVVAFFNVYLRDEVGVSTGAISRWKYAASAVR